MLRPEDRVGIPIYFEEWADVLNACPQLRPNACSPVELRRPMADHRATPMADQVLAFEGPQPLALSAFVLQGQALVVKGTGRATAADSPRHP